MKFIVLAPLLLAACASNVPIPVVGGNSQHNHVVTVPVDPPNKPVDKPKDDKGKPDKVDHDKGHGNDADGHDEDNKGKKK